MASPEEIEIVTSTLGKFNDTVLVELGAHHGEDTTWLLPLCHGKYRYVAVEPEPQNHSFIRERLGARVDLFAGAIGAVNGPVDFHRCEGNVLASGSIRKPKEHLKHFPDCLFPDVQRTECITLDELCRRYGIDHIDFVWSDIQGAERDLIAGGQRMLAKTRYLFTEFDDIEFYEGQANRETLLSLLPAWETVQLFKDNILLKNMEYA